MVFVVASSVVSPASAVSRKTGTAELLFQCAHRMGLMPVWITPNDTIAIHVDGQERYLNLARSHFNSESSAALAKNKYVTRRILERHGIRNIPYMHTDTLADAAAFLKRNGTIIAKPMTGFGARDINIITDPLQLEPLHLTTYILEKYIPGKEMRYLLLNDKVIAVHQSEYGVSVAEDRELQRLSYPRQLWSPVLSNLSLRVTKILDLKFAAVDFLIDSHGQAYVLEVNTVPGFKWFHAPSSGPAVDVARLFIEAMLDDLRTPAKDTKVKDLLGIS